MEYVELMIKMLVNRINCKIFIQIILFVRFTLVKILNLWKFCPWTLIECQVNIHTINHSKNKEFESQVNIFLLRRLFNG